MGKAVIAFSCVLLVVLAGASAGAARGFRGPLAVAVDGSDTGGCVFSPCRTIGYAVQQALPGDRIDVYDGTYHESVAVSKQLTLVGHRAVIDARSPGGPFDNGLTISGPGAAGTSVTGFTVEHAGREGILALQTSNLSIAHNEVTLNDQFGVNSPQCPADNPDDCGEAIHLRDVTGSTVAWNDVHDNIGGILLTDEEGPAAWNAIVHNRVLDNSEDCGITLASHFFHFGSPVAPGVAGVYQNLVAWNVSDHNGAAGIGMFAGPPGAAAWGNVVKHNEASGNGLPGVAIHSHQPWQNAEHNVVVRNDLSNNGADDDAETGTGAGVVVFADLPAGASPIQHTVVARNRIADDHFGIYLKGAAVPFGAGTNLFDNVDVPLSVN